jgi:hypothetical protein
VLETNSLAGELGWAQGAGTGKIELAGKAAGKIYTWWIIDPGKFVNLVTVCS